MRAICDACSKPQPAAWRAGDLCVHCGAAVRVEVRCFWCAKWTPSSGGAKFCRYCGGELVTPQQYGPARMLKEAGADRFTVPKMLRELDPAQIENFGRIYQRQAVVVARHVDELQFLERFLLQKCWSADLEEDLIPQLPWPEATFATLSAQPRGPGPRGGEPVPPNEDLAQVCAIAAATPFGITRDLAALARVRLDDWAAVNDAQQVYGHADDGSPLKVEAALTLSRWKIGAAVGCLRGDREMLKTLQAAATQPEFAALQEPLTVGRAILGEKEVDGLADALNSPDPESAFGAALMLQEPNRLRAALTRTPLERAAAGRKLIQLGTFDGLPQALLAGPLEVQMELVDELRRTKDPHPVLADTLLKLYETTPEPRLRVRLAEVLCRNLNPAWAPRLCEKAGTERYIFQALYSEAAALPPETVAGVARFMVEQGLFRMSQYGLPEAARRSAVPDTFVPAQFPGADAETRLELLRCAEEQLKERGDETLHRFVLNTVFGPYDGKTRTAAWWALSRWYAGVKYAWKGPFALTTAEIIRFFGSVGAFLPKLTAVLNDRDSMKEVGLFEFIADLLRSADDEFTNLLLTDSALQSSARAFVQALLGAVASDYWANVRSNAAELLSKIGGAPPWREEVLANLRARLADSNFDLVYYCDRAVKTINGERET
ncbi:MAG TPA: zinc ribbon domain-containing protein [Planctomycetota bacterium]|nr:zinc ribbon domain-containing protein [Planctomycetota bacterium]